MVFVVVWFRVWDNGGYGYGYGYGYGKAGLGSDVHIGNTCHLLLKTWTEIGMGLNYNQFSSLRFKMKKKVVK